MSEDPRKGVAGPAGETDANLQSQSLPGPTTTADVDESENPPTTTADQKKDKE